MGDPRPPRSSRGSRSARVGTAACRPGCPSTCRRSVRPRSPEDRERPWRHTMQPAPSPIDGPLQLPLVHARAALDVAALRLGVELLERTSALRHDGSAARPAVTTACRSSTTSTRSSTRRAGRRSLLTVRAAISCAVSSDLPCSSRPSLMCSYWRRRFADHFVDRSGTADLLRRWRNRCPGRARRQTSTTWLRRIDRTRTRRSSWRCGS